MKTDKPDHLARLSGVRRCRDLLRLSEGLARLKTGNHNARAAGQLRARQGPEIALNGSKVIQSHWCKANLYMPK